MKPDSRYALAETKVDLVLEVLREHSKDTVLPGSVPLLTGAVDDLTIAMEELRAAHAEVAAQREDMDKTCRDVQREQRRYVELFEDAPDGYVVTDIHGVIAQANLAAIRLFDSAREVVTGTPLALFVKEEDKAAFFGRLNEMEALECVRDWELRFRPWKGKPFWASVNIAKVQIPEQEESSLRWLIHDISNRRQAETELRDNQSQLDLALRSAGMGAWHLDITEDRRHFDNQACSLLGIDPKTFTGTSEEFFAMMHPDDCEKVRTALASAIEHKALYETEYRSVWPDGSVHCVATRGRLVYDDKGRPVRINGIVWDITERKQMEEELRASRDELELRVRERAVELLKANEELQRRREELAHVDRIATLSELTSSLAHELSQPLSAILSNAQAAERFLAMEKRDLEEVGGALSDIVDDTRRAGAIIQNLRSMLKKKNSERCVLDVNLVVQETLKLVAVASIRGRISIKTDLAADLPRIVGDPTQLQQVLINLILNGFHAMEGCEADCRRMTIRTSGDGAGAVRVDVCDTGCGVNEEDMGRIFERFFTTKPEGMGMGLSISKSIIVTHGGQLWAAPNPGSGMSFCFSLPVADTTE